jgi:hypothetical protein
VLIGIIAMPIFLLLFGLTPILCHTAGLSSDVGAALFLLFGFLYGAGEWRWYGTLYYSCGIQVSSFTLTPTYSFPPSAPPPPLYPLPPPLGSTLAEGGCYALLATSYPSDVGKVCMYVCMYVS